MVRLKTVSYIVLALGAFALSPATATVVPAAHAQSSGTAELVERLQLRISDLERMVSEMNGANEELRHENRTLKDRFDRFEREMDFRLGALEGTGRPPGAASGPTSGTASGTASGTGAERTAPAAGASTGSVLAPPGSGNGRNATAPAQRSTSAAPRAGAGVSLPAGSEEEQYNYAFELLNARDFAGAEQAFDAFIKAHPKGRLTGNAQYWLGETYYARGDFEQAAVAFMKGYQNYPGSAKGPDNLLKLGMSLSKLGKKNEACDAFSRIASLSPPASDAIKRRARSSADGLGCR
ncbi:tol-pal system protein YbgF [Phaeovibrio sulfidiphilus]|uniref:Cell division coordinator CpoB n=1 Tax=Phaeovibrio sulfidiphilus TaxID=1220600 RepID=A0A8J6YNE9_9PROT|nr:tol-pal system protein YbgF [Phaeovibrio sulfidiphilus]MBE1236112.1 tol-pal system protein YbgF [Phaeovibrio sulfidiphilus]